MDQAKAVLADANADQDAVNKAVENLDAADALIQKIQNAKVTVAKAVYSGKALKPKVTVKLNGVTLKANTDYTIRYANSKKAVKINK